MFVSAANRAERGSVSAKLEERNAEGKKMRVLRNGKILKKISLKLISEQFNFALDPQLVKLSRLF